MADITLDNGWTHEELEGDVYDVVVEWLNQNERKYINRALKDYDMLKPQYLTEQILNDILAQDKNLVQVYNEQVIEFGITLFDNYIKSHIATIMEGNKVSK